MKLTKEMLDKANENLNTMDFKGKPYVEVHTRIKAFRSIYPHGVIETKLLRFKDEIAIVKALIHDDEGNLLSTGLAYEKEGSSFINKTSFLENCETSAVGRALGMLGIGIDNSIASANEVGNAIKQQTTPKKSTITKQQLEILNKLPQEQQEKAFSIIKKDKFEDFTLEEASALIKKIQC